VRKYLHKGPDDITLPGASRYVEEFARFRANLSRLATALDMTPQEIHPFREYKTYMELLSIYLSEV
jgi:hypothetical protein